MLYICFVYSSGNKITTTTTTTTTTYMLRRNMKYEMMFIYVYVVSFHVVEYTMHDGINA